MIGIVNYGLGNVRAILNIYNNLGITASLANSQEDLIGASSIILPGVGNFDWAITSLNDSGLRQELDHQVMNNKKPVLGICVGMQMMANKSEEGILPGLGWIAGQVRKFDQNEENEAIFQLPHMGWNDITPRSANALFRGFMQWKFYFLHSYYFKPNNPENILAETAYGCEFASAVGRDNIFGVQFHPEKSHKWGIQLLKNFAEISKC